MDPMTILIIVGATIAILFLFVILFIRILHLSRQAKLQTKIALMQDSPNNATFDQGLEATESGVESDFEEKPKRKKVKK